MATNSKMGADEMFQTCIPDYYEAEDLFSPAMNVYFSYMALIGADIGD